MLKSVTMSAGENNRGSSSNQESQSKTQGTYVILYLYSSNQRLEVHSAVRVKIVVLLK